LSDIEADPRRRIEELEAKAAMLAGRRDALKLIVGCQDRRIARLKEQLARLDAAIRRTADRSSGSDL
jgi:uncharacterized coiled-coil protein SlyX